MISAPSGQSAIGTPKRYSLTVHNCFGCCCDVKTLAGGGLSSRRAWRYRSAYAEISVPNEGSVGLHERLGFQHIGTFPQVGFKLNAWHDVGYWRFDLGGDGLRPEDSPRFQAIC